MLFFFFLLWPLCGLIFYVWYNFLRVPAELAHLPVLPVLFTPASERRRRARELAKTHAFARQWLKKWQVVVLHPEPAKLVETDPALFEKAIGRFSRRNFITQFLGFNDNVVAVQSEDWKKHRAAVYPALDSIYIRNFTNIFNSEADKLLEELSKLGPQTPIHAHDWLQRFTLDCLGLACFGFDFESITNPDNEFSAVYHRLVDQGPTKTGAFHPKRIAVPFGLMDILPTSENRRMQQDVAGWNKIVDKIIKFGETSQDNNLTAHLLRANNPASQNFLTIEEVRSNIAVFFIAGHETSATSLAAAMWFLARYPEMQQKAYDEVVRVCGAQDDPTFQAQQELHYVSNVLSEALRLVPPLPTIPQRVVMQDTELAGLTLRKGTLLTISMEALHFLDTDWPDPDEFNPDRFANARHHPFSWQPFGAGARVCVGRTFSLTEQRVALARILQKFQLCLPEGAPKHIELSDWPGLVRVQSHVTLHPRE